MSLLYSTHTKQAIEKLHTHLPQSLLLEGLAGVGLYTIARHLGGQQVVTVVQPTDADGNVDMSAKGIIRLPQIHQLQSLARGKSTNKQVFIIDNADQMNHTAQNALLKILEEPNSSVHFILTSHAPDKLLGTILSRVQRITITPLNQDDSRFFINSQGVKDDRKIQQLLFIAGGRPAELSRLIANETYFTQAAGLVGDARQLISGSPADKLRVAMAYQSDKARALELLETARSISMFSLQRTPSRELITLTGKLATAYDRIAANGNVRLQLTNFVLN